MSREVNTSSMSARGLDARLFLIDEEFDRGVGLLLAGERAVFAAMETVREGSGLSKSDMQVLLAIRYAPGLSVTGIREQIGQTVPTFARIIGALDRRGLIERTQSRLDGRRRRLVLSDAGRAATDAAADAMRIVLRAAYRAAGPAHVTGARIMLEALNKTQGQKTQ